MKNWKYEAYRFIWKSLDLMFPPICGGCGKDGFRWCDRCNDQVKILNGILCDICGLPQNKQGICENCLGDKPYYRSLRAWAVFDDPVQKALHKLKYRRDISLGDALTYQMIPFVETLNWNFDMIIPVPLGTKRRKERGYNQVGMIAKPLSLAFDTKYLPEGLLRQTETRSQVGLTKQERKSNMKDVFKAGDGVKSRAILLMDDVATTGATLSSAAKALYESGARDVFALTVARALPRHGLTRV